MAFLSKDLFIGVDPMTHSISTNTEDASLTFYQPDAHDAPFRRLNEPLHRAPAGGSAIHPNAGFDATSSHRVSDKTIDQTGFVVLSYDGELRRTLDKASARIHGLLQDIQDLSIQANDPSRSSPEVRRLQTEINERLSQIGRISVQTQVQGVNVLAGGATLRTSITSCPSEMLSLTLKKIDVASLNLEGFSVAGPRTATLRPWELLCSPAGSGVYILPADIAIFLTIDGETSVGRVVVDRFNTPFIHVDAGAVGNPSTSMKFYRVEKEDFVIIPGSDRTNPAASIRLNILSSDLSLPVSHSCTSGPKTRDMLFSVCAAERYFGDAKGNCSVQGIQMHSQPVSINIDGELSKGELMLDVFDNEVRRYIKISAGAKGNSSSADLFYPFSDVDYVLTYEVDDRLNKCTAVANFDIRSSELRLRVANAPLEVLESAMSKLNAWRDELNRFAQFAQRVDRDETTPTYT